MRRRVGARASATDIAQSSPLIGTCGPTGTLGDLIDSLLPALLKLFHRLQRGLAVSGDLTQDVPLVTNVLRLQLEPEGNDVPLSTWAQGCGLACRFRSTRNDVEVADSKPESVGSRRW